MFVDEETNTFDHKELFTISQNAVTKNLNKVIDRNYYPVMLKQNIRTCVIDQLD